MGDYLSAVLAIEAVVISVGCVQSLDKTINVRAEGNVLLFWILFNSWTSGLIWTRQIVKLSPRVGLSEDTGPHDGPGFGFSHLLVNEGGEEC